MSLVSRLAAGLLALAPVLHGAAAARQVTIAPAPVERAAMVVTLTLPREFADGAILRDAAGKIVPLQAEADLSAKFIVARQAAGETLRFTLEPGRTPDQGNVQVVEEPSPPRPGAGIASAAGASMIQTKAGRLRVSVGGRPILYYQMDKDAVPREEIDPKFRRAGYLHPVLTPDGFPVTEGYSNSGPANGNIPLGISGDDPPVPSRLEFGGVDNTWSGPVHGGFTSWQRWVASESINASELVNESWELTAYVVPKMLGELNLFDLSITRSNATASPMVFPSGFGPGLRVTGPQAWEDQSPIKALSSALLVEGSGLLTQAGSPDLWSGTLSGSRWIGLKGPGRDRPAGFAILVTQPNFALVAGKGSFVLQTSDSAKPAFTPGSRVTVRQRFVVFDGPPDNALLEAIWNGYTLPAVVTLR